MPAPKKRSQKKQLTSKTRTQTVYQFKITLLESRPPIWRRILIPDGTLDDLHESIQTAMGWTNSHLHEFEIGRKRYGDPELLGDDWNDSKAASSLDTQLSELFGGKRPPKKLHYMYDFGDGWEHLIEFEGAASAESDKKYPCCVDGARACPPDDCGGVWGYAHFLEAIGDPKHEEHDDLLEWIGGKFDSEKFSTAEATKAMRKGLPNWRDFR
jgi:hypothetical protein